MPSAKRRVAAEARHSTPASIWYIESSALVAAFIEGDAAAQRAIRNPGRHVTSALTIAETHRAVIRARVDRRLSADSERALVRGLQTFARRCALIAVTDTILLRAGRPFPIEPVRTLDAIHLATLESLGEVPQLVTVVTRDVRVAENAQAFGYAVC